MEIKIEDGIEMLSDFVMPGDVEDRDWLGSGAFGTWIVPDYICFVSMKKAGAVHDDCYEKQYPKDLSDIMFHRNMYTLIYRHCKEYLRETALCIADLYYEAVKEFGDDAYNNCKKIVDDSV